MGGKFNDQTNRAIQRNLVIIVIKNDDNWEINECVEREQWNLMWQFGDNM